MIHSGKPEQAAAVCGSRIPFCNRFKYIFCISLTSTSCYVHCDIVRILPPRPLPFRGLAGIERLGRLRLPRTLVQTIGSVTRAAPSNDCIWSRLSAGTMSNSYLSGNVLSIVFSPSFLPLSPSPPFFLPLTLSHVLLSSPHLSVIRELGCSRKTAGSLRANLFRYFSPRLWHETTALPAKYEALIPQRANPYEAVYVDALCLSTVPFTPDDCDCVHV